MLVAFDDTDGPGGGCTTHLAGAILDRIGPQHQAGLPRLVRLRPENPYKTRGNAAVALPLVDELDPERVLEDAMHVVEAHARLAEGKGAGVAVFETPPDPAWYERGVREQLPLDAAQAALSDVPTATLGTGRGLVGALCAAAWDPSQRPRTYTRIAYRHRERWGRPRAIEPESVARLDDRHAALFDCWDPHDAHPVVAPRTPCPVLYGLRATDPAPLEAAAEAIESEPEARATTFATNQATDDHIDPTALEPVTITGTPEALPGGHVRAPAERDDGRTVDLMAFEPTGTLREGVRAFAPGDRVLPIGATKPEQINLEKALHVPAPRTAPTRCPGCGGQMGSTGEHAPRRCRRCGTRRAPETTHSDAGWIEADPSARRHLARPLALGLATHVADAAEQVVDGAEPPSVTP